MKIIPFEIELDYWKIGKKNYHTLRFAVLRFDGTDMDTSLLELGWYQGEFIWDFLFLYWVKSKIQTWMENR